MKTRILLIAVMLLAAFCRLHAQEEWQDIDWFSMIYGEDTLGLRSGSVINNTGAVGTPTTVFSVTPTGGAAYSIQIDTPTGVTGVQPEVAISYNSQQGNSIAGWGCGITGISAITVGAKDIFHDDQARGIRHDLNDAFYLDGQRLIELERISGRDSAVYFLEGNPYARVVLHGLNSNSQSQSWFSVATPDGMKYEYGRWDGKQSYYSSASNATKVQAWYITRADSPSGCLIQYSYETSDSYVYPKKISYGAYPCYSYVRFTYEARPDAVEYYLENTKVKMCKRLKAVTTSSKIDETEQVFRIYTLNYDDTSDGTTKKFSRLTTVTESNGNQESMNPITMEWDFLGAFTTEPSQSGVPLVTSSTLERFDDMDVLTADFNGDGLSDILQHVNADSLGSNGAYTRMNLYHIFLSTANADGSVTYSQYPLTLTLPLDFYNGKWLQYVNFPMTTDIDGDGLQDIIFPIVEQGIDNGVIFNCVFGKDIVSGYVMYHIVYYAQLHSTVPPAFISSDLDNDGHADIAILERGGNSGNYDFRVYKGTSNSILLAFHKTLSLSFDPKKLFAADFNSDGLTDIIAVGSNTYTIFWNTGGVLSANSFVNTSCTSGTALNDAAMLQMGDFNGDGQPDFLSNAKDTNRWYLLAGKADGTFSQSLACEINAFEISGTTKDDELFSCQVFDIDGDGKSDAVISKAMFSYSSGYYYFEKTRTFWMLSNGTTFSQLSSATSNRQNDAKLGHYAVGDMNGDGMLELVHYGYDCYDAVNANVNASLLHFTNGSHSPSTGKVTSFTDGLGAQTSVTYKPLTDINVYSKGSDTPSFPVVNVTPALPVVASTSESPLSVTTSYTYEGLKFHQQGRGLMGMTASTSSRLGITTESRVLDWHPFTFQPRTTTTTRHIDASTMTVTSTDSLVQYPIPDQYVPIQRHVVTTDYDGNMTTEDFVFSTTHGKPTSHTTAENDGKTTEETVSYSCHGGQHLPVENRLTQTVGNLPAYQNVTTYTYGQWGQLIEKVQNDDTEKALTTDYTYDLWGNVNGVTITGDDIETVTKTLTYDDTHRFVARSVERGYIVHEYTYDTWGNILTETDKTRSACPQTTTYTYDGWGNLVSATSPLGLVTSYSLGWGTTAVKRYFTLEEPASSPWIKTWYDERGREVLKESVGLKGVSVREATGYTAKGETLSKVMLEGSRQSLHRYEYDSRSRMTSDRTYVGGNNISNTYYSYGNRTKTTSHAGRSYTETYDSWGNVTQSTDPVSSVSYTYGPNGKPVSASSQGATVSMEYDEADNQKKLIDPDAGTQTYTYDVLGRLRTQKDGRNITTTFTYNNRGQLSQGQGTSYTYGTGTTNNGLLTSMSCDGYSASYQYDTFGRVTQETRTYGQGVTRTMSYTYNQLGQLASRTFPNQLTISYQYDSCGFLNKMYAGSQLLYEVTGYNGLTLTEKLGTQQLTRTTTFDNLGQPTSVYLARGGTTLGLGSQNYTYDYATGNLTARNINGLSPETFTYDSSDRLTGWTDNNTPAGSYSYLANGNIHTKSQTGEYSYGSSRPHAVTSIQNTSGNVPVTSTDLYLEYNYLGKMYLIEDYENVIADNYGYGPDHERWETGEGYYFGDYEERFTSYNSTQHTSYTYLDGGVLCVTSPSGTHQFYYMQRDHIGSIFEIVTATGSSVFTASYDPWGKQDIMHNDIGFYRGFTGHEMMPEFGLINMNGRLYDPVSARFLSPDNFVQQPWNSQNFNRYSYCLNNPLKYNDPSGEFILGSLLAAHLDLIHNIFSHGFNVSQYNWTKTINAWKIDMGMFKGDWKQIVNKWSWGIVNSALGNNIAHGLNLLGAVDGVSNMDGMVAIGGVTKGNSAFTIGHYSFGPKSYKATWKDHLFVHEYGHYMQSQLLGSSYLLTIGIPSLASTVGIGGNDHNSRWFEVDASRRGAKHFDKKYGSGAKGYIAGSADFFDIRVFTIGGYTSYYNLRAKSYKQDTFFPIHHSRRSIWDFIFPTVTFQQFPTLLINAIK